MVKRTTLTRCRSQSSAAPAGESRATVLSLHQNGRRSPICGSEWHPCSAAGSKASAKARDASSFDSRVFALNRKLIRLLLVFAALGAAFATVLAVAAPAQAADNAFL